MGRLIAFLLLLCRFISSGQVHRPKTLLTGDGRAEVAVGAEWNPGDTVTSGAVFYLLPPEDRTQRWTPVRLPHEPTL